MWEGLRQAGADKLDNPTVLEPSAGSGRFLEMQPRDLAAQSNGVEVEPNPLTNYSGSIGTLGWFARGICHGLTAALDSPPLDVFTFCPSSLLACGCSIVERRGGLSCPMRLCRLLPAESMPMSTA